MNLLSLARSKGNQTAVRFLENLLNLPATETTDGETPDVTNDHDASRCIPCRFSGSRILTTLRHPELIHCWTATVTVTLLLS